MRKNTLEHAKSVAERIKKKYKYGKLGKPEWFTNAVPCMEQDGGYSIMLCTPDRKLIPAAENEAFMVPIDGVTLHISVVTPPKYNIKDKGSK